MSRNIKSGLIRLAELWWFTLPLLAATACATGKPPSAAPPAPMASTAEKPRVVVTTDPELDDSNSLIRYLLYSTDFRTEGIIYASSQFHWKGDGTGRKWFVPGREYTRFGLNLCPCESWRWKPGERFIDDDVDIYERVYPNLRVHRGDYPTPTALRSKIRWGNVDFDGDISKDTPGSNLIRDLLLDENPEPIYLLAWGGASTIARALKSIQERYEGTADWPSLRARISRKAILSLSGDQDDTYANYIRPNWPDIRSLAAGDGGVGVGYGAFVFASAENAPYFSVDWTRRNVSSQGPFGEHYRVWGDGKQMVPGDRFDYFGIAGQTAAELRAKGYVVWLPPRPKGEFLGEGDTFTFFNLIDNGLGAYRDDTPGGWAGHVVLNRALRDTTRGRPARAPSFEEFMRNLERIGPEGPATRAPSPTPNFTPAAQNGFAARMKWSVTPRYADANHEPRVAIKGSARITARPGETVRFEGAVSDPDGNAVAVRWWRWKDVDTYTGDITLSNPTSLITHLRVPDDAQSGQTIQLVLEATDNGAPPLTRYQRVVVVVGQ
ncbi:MAG TPA: nucleoside hydrolase-like domain-containing protein [Gemmatimonadaceae bacterium]|nr:nucleoside hydrolase-like domain-containing protein [Gemmatimonadaceae bacterium]